MEAVSNYSYYIHNLEFGVKYEVCSVCREACIQYPTSTCDMEAVSNYSYSIHNLEFGVKYEVCMYVCMQR